MSLNVSADTGLSTQDFHFIQEIHAKYKGWKKNLVIAQNLAANMLELVTVGGRLSDVPPGQYSCRLAGIPVGGELIDAAQLTLYPCFGTVPQNEMAWDSDDLSRIAETTSNGYVAINPVKQWHQQDNPELWFSAVVTTDQQVFLECYLDYTFDYAVRPIVKLTQEVASLKYGEQMEIFQA